MQGLELSATVSKDCRAQKESFQFYSAMSHDTVPKSGTDENVELKHISRFWAVLLAGRDTTSMVNMCAYMEDYRCQSVVPKHHGGVNAAWKMSVSMPFLTNKRALESGEVLVLPFDGGLPEIQCEAVHDMGE